ncbi:MAG: ctaD [Planctomycetaceae bacterium]|nr:ctaD [Planctomycetaceae bacterium]
MLKFGCSPETPVLLCRQVRGEVPLMVGTRNVSFPRLLNYTYYTYLSAGLVLFGSLILNIGPDMGWFSYVPLAGPAYSPGRRYDLWSVVVTASEISAICGGIEIITTVFKQRAPGMSLPRIPLFVWSQLITGGMIIFAMPSVMLCSTMLSMDRLANVNTHFFNPAEGGDAILWQHLFWFFAHPEVYIIFIPATGFVATILQTFCRQRTFGYTPLVLAMVATAKRSPGHPVAAAARSPVFDFEYAFTAPHLGMHGFRGTGCHSEELPKPHP